MATATFLFHGELAEFLARGRRGGAFSHSCARAATVKHAIESLGVPHTEAGRLTVNDRAATLARIVREGDAIEVFPHRAADACPGEAPSFIADAHLGGLARLLRMLGFDTLFENAYTDRQILEIAGRERRVLLTRDRELLKCRDVLRGCYVHARKPGAQFEEVVVRYALARHAKPFTLCLHCNFRLEAAARSAVAERVPAPIVERYAEFVCCAGCRRIYWQGSHWERMRAMLGGVLAEALPVYSSSINSERR
ncbi:MAG: Mut7-C ubiquitin/RNAse domain-containing protein [Betaproteobacteria bacterium]|nr:Mut7-C ubiquitin/RNAse domain-containing protein [Betaproteobacteria bacterium]